MREWITASNKNRGAPVIILVNSFGAYDWFCNQGEVYMQDPEVLTDMTRDSIQYVVIPQIRHDSERGDYVGYDIAAYNSVKNNFVGMVCDVTLHGGDV